jgi:hypothetical protein
MPEGLCLVFAVVVDDDDGAIDRAAEVFYS